MISSSRKSKRILQPNATPDSYKLRNLDEIGLFPRNHLPNFLCKRKSFGNKLDRNENLDEELLKLNVGGTSFLLSPETILLRSAESLLTQFVFSSHNERLQMCTCYLRNTGEYFFERSAQLFDIIYQFYITGVVHKPTGICLDLFAEELAFWNIRKAVFAACAMDNDTRGAEPIDTDPPIDEFKKIRFGKLRRKVWELLEVPESSAFARYFACSSLFTVVVATIIMVISSIPDCQVAKNITQTFGYNSSRRILVFEPHPILKFSELLCMIWFTVEYVARIAVAIDRKSVFLQTLNIIDLVAIVPFYIELFLDLIGIDIRTFDQLNGALLMMRILRVSRVIRIFKLGRYSSGLRSFARTLGASKKQLSMLAIVLATGILFFSTLVYNLEKDAPDTQFVSIPASFWWCIVTMTTVGYGDMYPTTTMGKVVGSGAIACGVLVLALPITIIVDNFMEFHEESLAATRGGECGGMIKKKLAAMAAQQQNAMGGFMSAFDENDSQNNHRASNDGEKLMDSYV